MSANEQQHVVSQVHVNRIDPATGSVAPGWEVTVRDPVTGTLVPVFVPDTVYGGDQARTLIQHELDKVRAVHGLTF